MRHYLGPQGYTEPQTGFIGSAFTVQSSFVDEHFTRIGPHDQENPFFYGFGPFQALDGGELSPSPPAPQTQVNLEPRPQEAKPSKLFTG